MAMIINSTSYTFVSGSSNTDAINKYAAKVTINNANGDDTIANYGAL